MDKTDKMGKTTMCSPAEEYKDIKKQIRNSILSVVIGTVLGAIITLLLK